MGVYLVQGEVVVNAIEMVDTMVYFGETISGYVKLSRNLIMLSDE